MTSVKAKIKEDLTVSMHSLAKDLDVNEIDAIDS